jgi:antitoxin component HigA of HigAB toxin-antitoxin module
VNDKWSEVGSKNAVLNILSDKRDALKGYINKEKLNYNKSTELFLEKVVRFYEVTK